jgi:hypothetical protein
MKNQIYKLGKSSLAGGFIFFFLHGIYPLLSQEVALSNHKEKVERLFEHDHDQPWRKEPSPYVHNSVK